MPLIRQKRKGNITKSGAISLQPKNQLNEIDNLQGTIPLDLSINGHKLVNTKISFDDSSRNYVFGQNYTIGNISEGLPTSDSFYGSIISTPNTIGTAFSKNCHISKNFIKDERQKEILNIDFNPYKEESLITIDKASEFYVSGTSPLISANFQQSLKSRERIEIDISNSRPNENICETQYRNIGWLINTFSYYNFSNNRWTRFNGFAPEDGTDRIVNMRSLDFGGFYSFEEIESEPERLAIPFSPTTWNKPDRTGPFQFISGSIAEPISNFGFPFSKKYDPLDENLLKMSNYIDKPFLLEKIIIKCVRANALALSIFNNSAISNFPLPLAMTSNFFILNNKKIKSKRKLNNIDTESIKTYDQNDAEYNLTGDLSEDTIRELVTYAKIVTANSGSNTTIYDGDSIGTKNTYDFEKLKEQADDFSEGFLYYIDYGAHSLTEARLFENNLEVDIEVPVRQSIANKNISHLNGISSGEYFFVGNSLGTRTLLGKDLNRSLVNNSENYSSVTNQDNSVYNLNIRHDVLDNDNRQVPYVLYPEDELIIGFSAFSNFYFGDYGFSFSSYLNDAKIILVGTPINNDRPKFEFDKRFLTSKNLRAGIVGDKFNTDKFDTLPIQFYASSSIDRIVDSTGNEKIDREVSGYYSGGNRGTLLKAVEMQNNDISLTGSLLSEKIHFNYNSYGNYSDIYQQRPYTSYFKLGDNVVYYPVEKKFYNTANGEHLSQNNTLSFNNSLESRIESPYKEE